MAQTAAHRVNRVILPVPASRCVLPLPIPLRLRLLKRSPNRRAGIAIHYMPTTPHFYRTLMKPGDSSDYTVDVSSRPLWLLRGIDRSGRNDFRIGQRRC
jgi:hypothetical protein